MATRKLINGLNQEIKKDIGKKVKISFDEKKINKEIVDILKLYWGTSSTQRVIEKAFDSLALSELKPHKSIHSFPAYDYMQKLLSLEDNEPENACAVYLPTWIVAATSKFVKNKYQRLEFKSVEEVIDLVISFLADETKSLWSSDL
ncbi:MAG: hypothetical protein WBB28_06050 [Crinalium sp.]